jgi:hypothetical protein
MPPREIRLVYDDARHAGEAYFSGLRHGLATADVKPQPTEGDEVQVVVDLRYANEILRMSGVVVHSSPVATVIRLADVPSELHLLMGAVEEQRPDEGPSASTTLSDFHLSDDTQPLDDDAEATVVTQVPADLHDPEPVAPPAPVGRETLEGRIGIPVPYDPSLLVPGVARFRGDFAEVSPSSLFLRIHAERLTGVGVILVDDGRYWLYVLDGSPVHYLREPPREETSTAALLLSQGLVPPDVMDHVELLSALTARPLVSLVTRLGLVSDAQMTGVRREQARLTTADLLGRTDGSLRFYEFPEVRDVFREAAVNVVDMLWHDASESVGRLGPEEAEEQLAAIEGRHVALSDLGKRVLHELPLKGQQREFLNQLTRPTRQVSKLMKRARISTPMAMHVLLCLEQMGVVAIAGGSESGPESPVERSLRARFGQLDGDPFTLLDLHWSALPEELRAACEDMERELREYGKLGAHISNYDDLRSRLKARIQEIRQLGEDEEALAAAVAEVADPADRTAAAVLFARQGEMARFRDDPDQARLCFRRVLATDPGETEGKARRERARDVLERLER